MLCNGYSVDLQRTAIVEIVAPVLKRRSICVCEVLSFVEDLEQYLEFWQMSRKSLKCELPFSAKKLKRSSVWALAGWWLQSRISGGTKYFFLRLTCGQYCFLARESILFYGGFVVSDV